MSVTTNEIAIHAEERHLETSASHRIASHGSPVFNAGPELCKALAEAQARCVPATKDRRNEFHRYDYASAESIIATGKAALAESGLSLIPVEQSLLGSMKEGIDRFELVRKFLLLHSSGQSLPIVTTWPVVPDKGRPLDKATAAASTLSLSYTLRDLLLMPRVDPDDEVDARNDRDAGSTADRDAGQTISEDRVALLGELVRISGTDAMKFLEFFKVGSIREMTFDTSVKAEGMLREKIAAATAGR